MQGVKYYRLLLTSDDGWVVSPKARFDDGSELDVWAYRRGRRIDDARPIPFEIVQEGVRQDFNVTPFSPTVVSRRMADVLASLAPDDIQRLPARVYGELAGDWEVVNVVTCLDCIDHRRSIITYYPPDHRFHPGEPRGVLRLVVDPAPARDRHVFLPKGWPVAVIASQVVRDGLEEIGATGVRYEIVTK